MYITDIVISESAEHEVGTPNEWEDFDIVVHGVLPQVTDMHPFSGNKHYDQQKGYDLKSGHVVGPYGSAEYEMEG